MKPSISEKFKTFLVGSLLLSAMLASADQMQPVDLQCEYRTNPLGIDHTLPRLSWQIQDQQNARGLKQTAYRLLVASSKQMLAEDRADLWDSGKVDSGQSALVPYAGKPLSSGLACYWKVQVWTDDLEGKKASAWSEPARFSIGLLEKSDWKGSWINYSGNAWSIVAGKKPEFIAFRNTGQPEKNAPKKDSFFRGVFNLKSIRKIDSASMLISADETVELWVNGKPAGAGDKWHTAYHYNVKSLLKSGDNIIAVKATPDNKGNAGLIGSLTIHYQDGETQTISTGEHWQASQTAEENWQTAEQPSQEWSKAKIAGRSGFYPWVRTKSKPHGHNWFRKTFTLEASPAKAFVHVASLGYHELYVNGKKVDDSVLAPAGSRLDKRVLYVTYDVTEMLRDDKNVLAIWHGPGWTRFFRFFKANSALLVQANITTKSGENRSIVSDETWKCWPSESRTIGDSGHGGYGGEDVDARKQIEDWNEADFDDSNWDHPTKTTRDVILSAQTVEPDRVIEEIKAVEIEKLNDGDYKVVLERNYTGWLEIRNLHGKPGQPIIIRIADDPESRGEFGQLSAYFCGEEPGTFRNRFNYAGGRYVRIEGLSYEPKLADISGYAVGTDPERTGHFESSDELLNRIYETDLWTFRANTLNGVTMDCPHRERLGYGEVAWATAWGCGLPNYRAGAFYTNVVRNWCDVQFENGMIRHVAPHMRDSGGGPLWSSAPLTTGWEMYRHYGDKRVLETSYPTYKKFMEYLRSFVSEEAGGILTRNMQGKWRFLGDWAAPNGRRDWGHSQEALLFNNCVYALDLILMIDIADTLGKKEDAARYAEQLKTLRKNIHEKFFIPSENVYLDSRQVHQAFPLYVGVVPEDLKPAVIENLKKEITETRPYLDMGSSGLPVLLHYLIEEAEWNDILYTHLSKTTKPSYGYFLEQGETTWPEYWEVNVSSKIHTCYTGVASWFIKGIGGIRPDPEQPGYKSFVIKPHLVGDLTFANTSMESLYGKIVSNWSRKDGEVTLHVEVPPNTTAKIYLPVGDRNKIRESGKPLEKVEGMTILGMVKERVVLSVAAGHYTFVSGN